MNIRILQQIEGAKQANGLTVVIDVFRAFSLECYLFDRGAKEIIAVGDLEEAFRLKKEDPARILIGERKGRICEGCDFGNSPAQTAAFDFSGKTVVHTTSAGTQGIANAVHADEIITGSLVNARAIAEYIQKRNPEEVSLVCMGLGGEKETAEDTLCAEYIRSLIKKDTILLEDGIEALKRTDGKKFFREDLQEVFPREDFFLCTAYNKFPFVLRVEKSADGKNMVHKVSLF